jgi:hypothetical protein
MMDSDKVQHTANELCGPIMLPTNQVVWQGDVFHDGVTIKDILEGAESFWPTPEECSELSAFYAGHQWDTEILSRRYEQSRPALVLNMLPAIIERAIAATRIAGQCVLEPQVERAKLIVTRRNMDAQRMYNYLCSVLCEEQKLRVLEGAE